MAALSALIDVFKNQSERNFSMYDFCDKTKKNTAKTPEKTVKEEKKTTEKKPFYEGAPKSKQSKKKLSDKNKGVPHGRKAARK